MSRPVALGALAANAAVLVVLARLFSPFVLPPVTAAVILVVVCGGPAFRSPVMMGVAVAMLLAAIQVPFAGEALGLLAPTMHVSDGALAIRPFAATPTPVQVELGLCAYVVIAVACRRSTRFAARTWHVATSTFKRGDCLSSW